MNDGGDNNGVWCDAINNTIALINNFAQVIAAGFWNVTANVWKINKPFGAVDNALGELSGVVW